MGKSYYRPADYGEGVYTGSPWVVDNGFEDFILTTSGWKKSYDLSVGDWVYNHKGSPAEVLRVGDTESSYRFTFSDGSSVILPSGSSLFTRHTNWKDREYRFVEAEELLRTYKRGTRNNYRVRLDTILETESYVPQIDPYLFGYWLGDGMSKSPAISVGAKDINWVSERLSKCSGVIDARVAETNGSYLVYPYTSERRGDGNLQSTLRHLGVLNHKHIPLSFLSSPSRYRLSVLRGMMDSDGTAVVKSTSSAMFTSSYSNIAFGFHSLARSLGIGLSPYVTSSYYRGKRVRDRTKFWFQSSDCPFEMERKEQRWGSVKPGVPKSEMSLTSITQITPKPSVSITIDDPLGVYLMGPLFTPVNTSA